MTQHVTHMTHGVTHYVISYMIHVHQAGSNFVLQQVAHVKLHHMTQHVTHMRHHGTRHMNHHVTLHVTHHVTNHVIHVQMVFNFI